MKTFWLPISDCGLFVAGEIDETVFHHQLKPVPQYGVIVWYESKEMAKAALLSAMNSHWPETSDHQSAGVPKQPVSEADGQGQ